VQYTLGPYIKQITFRLKRVKHPKQSIGLYYHVCYFVFSQKKKMGEGSKHVSLGM
jgi:hypothetical protein